MIKKKTIAVIIATVITFSNVATTFAQISSLENTSIINTTSTELEDGIYKIENDALYIDKDKESVARKYLNNISIIEVKDKEISLTLTFTEKDVIKNMKFTLEDKEVTHEVVKEEEKLIEYKLTINSIEDILKVNADIQTPIFPNPMNVDFRIALKADTLTKVEDGNIDTEIPDEELDNETNGGNQGSGDNNNGSGNSNTGNNNGNGENLPSTDNSGQNSGSNNETSNVSGYKNGTYKMNNKVITDSKIGYEAARQSLNTINYMEVKNNKMYITLGFGQTDLMQNIRVIVNGNNTSYTTLSKDTTKNTMDIKFEVPSLSADVVIKAYIPAIEQDISFGVGFDSSSVTKISEDSVSQPLGTEVTNSSLSNISEDLNTNTDNDNQEQDSEELEDNLSGDYEKRYSIENEVIHDSAIGRKMARKYLYQTSYIDEDKDNQKYLTLTFSGTSVMENFKIKVNGEEVEFEVIDQGNSVKSFRFKITDVNDDIQFFMFIKPVNMNIDFKIKLLEETMKLLDEKEVSVDSVVSGVSTKEVSVLKIALITSLMTTVMVSMVFLIGFKIYIKRINKK